MIVDNRGDASHEGKTCRHVEVKMERLAEPAKQTTDTRQHCLDITVGCLESPNGCLPVLPLLTAQQRSQCEKSTAAESRWRALLYASISVTHIPR